MTDLHSRIITELSLLQSEGRLRSVVRIEMNWWTLTKLFGEAFASKNWRHLWRFESARFPLYADPMNPLHYSLGGIELFENKVLPDSVFVFAFNPLASSVVGRFGASTPFISLRKAA